jgi:hypothetical protein
VPHCLLDGKDIFTGFIQVKPKSMTQAVKIKTAVSETSLFKMPDKNVVDGLLTDVRALLHARKQPVILLCGTVRRPDVRNKKVVCLIRKDCETIRTILAAGDVDTVLCADNVAAMQAAELTDTDTGGVKKGDLCFVFRVVNGVNDRIYLLTGRNLGEVLVVVKIRDFPLVPVLVEHIVEEIAELGDVDVDGTGIEFLHILQPADVRTHLLPGNRR